MATLLPMTREFLELGSGTPGSTGRASGNLNHVVCDTDGNLSVLKQNLESTSRPAGSVTIADFTVTTTPIGSGCIQPVTGRFMHFVGFWSASVQQSSATDDSDFQYVLFRGRQTNAVLVSGQTHTTSGSEATAIPTNAVNGLSSVYQDLTVSNFADVSGGRFGFIRASAASDATTADCWLSLPLI